MSTYFPLCSWRACFSFSSSIAACLLSSGFFKCRMPNRGSSGMMPALVVAFFLTDKLKQNAFSFYCSPELWLPGETAWEIFITWSPLQRMPLKSVLLSSCKAPCHIYLALHHNSKPFSTKVFRWNTINTLPVPLLDRQQQLHCTVYLNRWKTMAGRTKQLDVLIAPWLEQIFYICISQLIVRLFWEIGLGYYLLSEDQHHSHICTFKMKLNLQLGHLASRCQATPQSKIVWTICKRIRCCRQIL